MDFAKLLRDAFRETIGFVGACAFYLVAPLRWPTRWAERVTDPSTPAAQGYVETRLFFFLSVAAWIVFIHVFLPAPGTAPTPDLPDGAVDRQRQQVFDSFVQAFAGGLRGAAATGLVLGALAATGVLDAWLRLRAARDADAARRHDLVVVALGVVNVYVFVVARVAAYLGREPLAELLGATIQWAGTTDWPPVVETVMSIGSGGPARNLVLLGLVAALLLLHLSMAWVLVAVTRFAAPSTAAPDQRRAASRNHPVLLALAGFAAVCIGLLSAESIREGQPRIDAVVIMPPPAGAAGDGAACRLLVSVVNAGERPLLLTASHRVVVQFAVARLPTGGAGSLPHPVFLAAAFARIDGRAEPGALIKPGETALVTTGPVAPLIQPAAPIPIASLAARATHLAWIETAPTTAPIQPLRFRAAIGMAGRCVPGLLAPAV